MAGLKLGGQSHPVGRGDFGPPRKKGWYTGLLWNQSQSGDCLGMVGMYTSCFVKLTPSADTNKGKFHNMLFSSHLCVHISHNQWGDFGHFAFRFDRLAVISNITSHKLET